MSSHWPLRQDLKQRFPICEVLQQPSKTKSGCIQHDDSDPNFDLKQYIQNRFVHSKGLFYVYINYMQLSQISIKFRVLLLTAQEIIFSHNKIYTNTTSLSPQHHPKHLAQVSLSIYNKTDISSIQQFTPAQDSLMLTPQHSHATVRQQWNSIHIG